MCLIELVDFNEIYGNGIEDASAAAKKTRRGRKKADVAETAVIAETVSEVEVIPEVVDTPEVETTPEADASTEETKS